MRKLLAVLPLILFSMTKAQARELTIDTTDSGILVISTTVSSPTLILTSNPYALRTYITNISTNNIFIGGMSPTATSTSTPTSISLSLSTGSYCLFGSTGTGLATPAWSPDGVNDPFTGPLWALAAGSGGSAISRVRFK